MLSWTSHRWCFYYPLCRLSFWWKCFPAIRGRRVKRMARHYMVCTLLVSSWSLHKTMWVRSSNDCSFARTCKSITRCFHRYKEVTKSHVPAVNTLARINVPEGQLENAIANESKTRLKRGIPIGSKDLIHRKRKGITYEKLSTLEEFTNMKGSNDET